MTTKWVFGVSNWPDDEEDFRIVKVGPGESDECAIARAKSNYSSNLECYTKELMS